MNDDEMARQMAAQPMLNQPPTPSAHERAALERVRRYVEMRKAQPLRGTDDQIHRIHPGTEWDASLNLSDLALVVAMAGRT